MCTYKNIMPLKHALKIDIKTIQSPLFNTICASTYIK